MLDRIREAMEGQGLTPLHEVRDVPELLGICESAPPGIVVIAVPRPDTATVEAVRALRQAFEPAVNVVVVCDRSGDGDVHRALAGGVTGVVLNDEVERALVPVLRVVDAGQVSVPGAHGDEIRARVLTTREKQILGLVVMGMTNAADRLQALPRGEHGEEPPLLGLREARRLLSQRGGDPDPRSPRGHRPRNSHDSHPSSGRIATADSAGRPRSSR